MPSAAELYCTPFSFSNSTCSIPLLLFPALLLYCTQRSHPYRCPGIAQSVRLTCAQSARKVHGLNAGDVGGGGAHTMTPVDPRIQYRYYSQWQCDHCGTINTHGGQLWTLFHCNQCDNHDMCLQCFFGHKHHLYQHGLVVINSDDRGTPSHTHTYPVSYVVDS